jgi:hypothetical protein
MKGYVYMIGYYEKVNGIFKDCGQIECTDKKDLITQCKLLNREYIVEQIKLVNDKDRYLEKEISKSLYNQCKKILGNKLL